MKQRLKWRKKKKRRSKDILSRSSTSIARAEVINISYASLLQRNRSSPWGYAYDPPPPPSCWGIEVDEGIELLDNLFHVLERWRRLEKGINFIFPQLRDATHFSILYTITESLNQILLKREHKDPKQNLVFNVKMHERSLGVYQPII